MPSRPEAAVIVKQLTIIDASWHVVVLAKHYVFPLLEVCEIFHEIWMFRISIYQENVPLAEA